MSQKSCSKPSVTDNRRHEQLVGGKSKQCEVYYPEKFEQLMCASIKREIADAK